MWYIIETHPNREKTVMDRLKTNPDVMDKVEIFLPMENFNEIKSGKKIIKTRPMYPRYVFVKTEHIGELQYFVRGCAGALRLVKDGSDYTTMKDSQIESMRGNIEEVNDKATSRFTYEVGESVKVMDGPFGGMNGIVSGKNKDLVKVDIKIFGRVNEVEFKSEELIRYE